MKKWTGYFALAIVILVSSMMFPATETSAHTTNSCTQLKVKLTDPLAIELDKSGGQKVIWEKVSPKLLIAKDAYEKEIKKKGWKITYTSAYRPQQYQDHFYEIKQLMDSNKADSCVKGESSFHGLAYDVAKVSNHTSGFAFDAKVYNKSGELLNVKNNISSELKKVANSVGLKLHIASDPVHHELIDQSGETKPNTNANKDTTEYAFNATGTLKGKHTVYISANTTSGSYGSFSQPKTVQIIAVVGDFYKIKYSSKNGYAYMKQANITLKVTETSKAGTGVITSSNGFNVRQYPYNTAKILTTVAKNKTVTVLAVSGDWYKIKVGSVTGYINAVKSGMTFKGQTGSTTSAYPKTGYVNTTSTALNVRKTASSTGQLLGTVAKGATIKVTGASGNWYSISYNNQTGYVSKDYVTFTKPAAPVTAYPKTGYVKTASTALNVRKTASSTGQLLGTVAKGATIKVTGASGNWYSISYNNQTGYVSKDYVTFTKPAVPVETYPKTGYVKTKNTGLNVRQTASSNGNIIGQVLKGSAVKITGKSGNWYKVTIGSSTGYVSADYITFTKSEAGNTPSLENNISKALPASKQKLASDATFNNYMPTLESIEGGYSDHPLDKGGKTNLGITEKLYLNYYPKGNINTITKAQATDIYKKEFWNKQAPTIITERLAVVLFDTAVNQGNSNAWKIIQIQLGMTGKAVDGILGSNTKTKMSSLSKAQQDALALKILQVRKNYRPSTAEFQAGWANRDKRIYDYISKL